MFYICRFFHQNQEYNNHLLLHYPLFQHYHKLPKSTSPKTRVSRLNNLLNERCISSIKNYCKINKYDYFLSDKSLGWKYFNKKFNNKNIIIMYIKYLISKNIINYNHEIITRAIDGQILSGITRKTIAQFAKLNNLIVKEEKFKKEELYKSKEVFLTSASSFVTPIIKVDDIEINDGKIGQTSINLRNLYFSKLHNN